MVRPADAAAQLVQVGQAVGVGLVDEDRVRPGNVEAALDDRRGEKDVGRAADEGQHRLLQFRLPEPAVDDADRRLRHDRRQPLGHLVNVVDPVVHEEHLASAGQLAVDRPADQGRVPAGGPGLDRDPRRRRRGQVGDVADAEHRHVERSRDRCRGHRQHVHARPQGLEPLLDVHPEPLLLVHDHQPEVGEVDVGLGEAVRADDDVHRLAGQSLQRLALLGRRRQPGQAADREGKLREPGGERPPVLLGEHGRRHEHRHLRPRLHCLEGGPHGELGLAEADVTAQQSVHRPRPLQVAPDRLHGRELIGRLREGKGLLELTLPGRVDGKGDARTALPRGLETDHVGGHVGHRPLHGVLLLRPQRAADLGELGGELPAADVFLHQLDARGGDVDPRIFGELDLQELLGAAMLLQEPEAAVAADAVGDVDHVVPLVQVEERVDRPGEPLPHRPGDAVVAVEKLGARYDHDLFRHEPEAPREPAAGECQPPRAGRGRRGEQFAEPRLFRLRRADDPHLLVATHRLQLVLHPVEDPREPLHALDRQRGGGLHARHRDRGQRHRRQPVETGEDVIGIEEDGGPVRPTHAAEPLLHSLRLGGELPGLNEGDPRAIRQQFRQLRAAAAAGFVHHRERGHVDGLDRGDAPLRDEVERPQPLDLVAAQFQPQRPIPVGREQVDDATAAGELPRRLDGIDGQPAARAEPVGEFRRVEPIPHGESAGSGLDLARIGERHEQRLDARHHHGGCRAAGQRQPLHDREAGGQRGILGVAGVLPRILGGGQQGRGRGREQGEVVEERLRLGRMGQDDDQRPRGVGSAAPRRPEQRRHGERRRRSPGSADRPPVSRAETGDDVGEPTMGIERFRQPEQSPGPASFFGGCHWASRESASRQYIRISASAAEGPQDTPAGGPATCSPAAPGARAPA